MLAVHSQRKVICRSCNEREFYWWHEACPGEACQMTPPEYAQRSWVLRTTKYDIPADCTTYDHWVASDVMCATKRLHVQLLRDEEVEAVKAVEVPATPVPETSSVQVSDDKAQKLALLESLLAPSIDKDEIRNIVSSIMDSYIMPTTVVVDNRNTGQTIDIEGLAHNRVPRVLGWLSAKRNVWMVGPAGTGKSTIGEQCAQALGVKFYSMSLTANMPLSEIQGFTDANGTTHRPVFRECFENGGLCLIDEVDNGNPNTLGKINQALANGVMAFPDGMVKKHPDAYFIAAANTYGTGPDRMFVGRLQIDFASLDRFVQVEIPVDEGLEMQLALAQGADETRTTEWVRYIRALRQSARDKKMNIDFTPRSSMNGCVGMALGMKVSDIVEDVVKKGISSSDWLKVSDGIKIPA